MTLEEKLDKFKNERVGLWIGSIREAQRLANILMSEGFSDEMGRLIDTEEFIREYEYTKKMYGSVIYADFNRNYGTQGVTIGSKEYEDYIGYDGTPIEILDVTIDDLDGYENKHKEE